MKQSIFTIFSFAIAIGCLTMALPLKAVQKDISVSYTFDDTCGQRIKSIERYGPNTLNVVSYYSDKELQLIQRAYNQPSNYELAINEDEENNQFVIDVAIKLGDGNNIHIVQSREDFMNNSSVNVESIELQWLGDLTPNDEGSVELVGQEVNEELTKLIFNLTDDLQPNCTDTLTMLFDNSFIDIINISIVDSFVRFKN